MAYRYGNRDQQTLLPPSIEDYVSDDAPVRAYDAMIETMDLAAMGFVIDHHRVGNCQYDPKVMLKLLVYGYSYGIRSSRKLERECHYNLSFIWLTGGLKPDHKTIAEFRRNNKAALSNVLKQCVRFCIKLGLIEGSTLFVDGSKVRASASINSSWNEDKCSRHFEKIDNRIAQILSECEQADQSEAEVSLVKMQKELADTQKLRARVVSILNTLKAEDKKTINSTDPDCVKIHGRQGSHAGYNAQVVVDERHGLIVSSDVVNENNDLHQFADQIEKAHKILGKQCNTACADAGYATVNELEKIDSQGVKVIVPSAKQAAKIERSDAFDKSHFKYDKASDCYICPEGKALGYSHTEVRNGKRRYRADVSACRKCKFREKCTTNPRGRTIVRLLHEQLKEKLEVQYEQRQSQDIYRLRKQKVELPFGHIKHNLKVSGFLLRGLGGVKAEMSILSSCFNIARMISLIGVCRLIAMISC